MLKYEKVTFRDGDSKRSIFLRISGDSRVFLSGVEVDKEGDEIEPPGFGSRRRIIEKQLIVSRRPYVMDNRYGELVPKGSETK